MRHLFPPENRINARVIIPRLPHQSASSDQAIAMAFENTASMASRALFKYATIRASPKPEMDTVVELDCYVFNASQLSEILLNARQLGERNAMRWLRQKP